MMEELPDVGESQAAAAGGGLSHTLLEPDIMHKKENLTCKEAWLRARNRCGQIGSVGDVCRYLYDHRAMIGFFFVVCSLGGLLFFGFLFYYEPRTMSYKNITIPVLHGFDVVAYFSLGKWSHGTKGRPEIALKFHNWTDDRDHTVYEYEFWFVTEANREMFKRSPYKYVPRFGGFSAYRLAHESYWDKLPDPRPHGWHAPAVHPDAFVVHDGVLYMDYSLEHKRMFLQNADAVIELAERKWIAWYGGLLNGPLNNFAVRGVFTSGDDSDSTDDSEPRSKSF